MKYSRGGNLLRYVCAKNCQNIAWFDKVIAEIKIVQFFIHMVELSMQIAR